LPYAEVCVNSPIARRQTYSYSTPNDLSLTIGQAVWVPFGDKILQGIVLELSQYPSVEQTREILGVIDNNPMVSPPRVKLIRWLSDYYLCPLYSAVAPMLPTGFGRKSATFISTTASADEYNISSLTPLQSKVIEMVRKQGNIKVCQLERSLGKKKAQLVVSQLASLNLIIRNHQLEPVRIKPKQKQLISLAIPFDKAKQEVANLLSKRAFKQAALLESLIMSSPKSKAEVMKKTNCQLDTVKALLKKGLIQIHYIEVKSQPIDYSEIKPTLPLRLTTEQQEAFVAIKKSLRQRTSATFLLHGVTGSGKTEVYLQVLAEVLKMGRQGIVLVPEISLTPQTIERFAGRFPNKVAIIHSGLSPRELFDQWYQIRKGNFDIVIGVRSAIFAPLSNLGLIIIDEEHEWNYKQDVLPRYHARTVALKLAEFTQSAVILGSATPDVETYYHAQGEDYKLIKLIERVTPRDGTALPQVELINMKDELKAGNRSFFSRSLKKGIDKAISNNEQVILFFNRRGAASLIQCRNCRMILQCHRCQAPLNYHSSGEVVVCHQCNKRSPVPQLCPHCKSYRLKFLGGGTQKLEREVSFFFPEARILRWDSDAIRGKYGHQEIMNSFRKRKADILIGTQMVTKGLDVPRVTLVGVISADTNLNLPDFRAGERSFQMVSQVAGRAGRGILGGKVIIQTFYPNHYAIQAALKHDYVSFYNKEVNYRRQLINPPFSQLVHLIYHHTNNTLCQKEAERMKRLLNTEIETAGISEIIILGPVPAFIQRLRGRFRWQLVLRGLEISAFLSQFDIPQGWVVDVDPVGLA
jgi:primosomal protein N' (replication factor Y)